MTNKTKADPKPKQPQSVVKDLLRVLDSGLKAGVDARKRAERSGVVRVEAPDRERKWRIGFYYEDDPEAAEAEV